MQHESFEEILDGLISPAPADRVSDETLDQWMLRSVWIGQHLSGTCKMGPAVAVPGTLLRHAAHAGSNRRGVAASRSGGLEHDEPRSKP
jgi:hypothetical protein